MNTIQISISHTMYFNNQREMGEFLDIKNTSKKSISTRCRVFGYTVEFNNN